MLRPLTRQALRTVAFAVLVALVLAFGAAAVRVVPWVVAVDVPLNVALSFLLSIVPASVEVALLVAVPVGCCLQIAQWNGDGTTQTLQTLGVRPAVQLLNVAFAVAIACSVCLAAANRSFTLASQPAMKAHHLIQNARKNACKNHQIARIPGLDVAWMCTASPKPYHVPSDDPSQSHRHPTVKDNAAEVVQKNAFDARKRDPNRTDEICGNEHPATPRGGNNSGTDNARLIGHYPSNGPARVAWSASQATLHHASTKITLYDVHATVRPAITLQVQNATISGVIATVTPSSTPRWLRTITSALCCAASAFVSSWGLLRWPSASRARAIVVGVSATAVFLLLSARLFTVFPSLALAAAIALCTLPALLTASLSAPASPALQLTYRLCQSLRQTRSDDTRGCLTKR